jgi:hypothetical protein
MTERERRSLLRRRANVTSWRDVLESARNEYEATMLHPREISLVDDHVRVS